MDWTARLAACFAHNYADARAKFLAIAARYGAPVRSYLNPLKGPEDEELATDTVWLGPADARRVMVLTSATHGIEGFCGSGCQIDWLLGAGPARLPDGVAALIVHAVNPYGFAWLRRVTEENVDLNRNGIDFGQPPPANPGYAELREALSPPALSDPVFEKTQATIAAWRAKHGDDMHVRAVVQGSRNLGNFFLARGTDRDAGGARAAMRKQVNISGAIDAVIIAEVKQPAGVCIHAKGDPRLKTNFVQACNGSATKIHRITKVRVETHGTVVEYRQAQWRSVLIANRIARVVRKTIPVDECQ